MITSTAIKSKLWQAMIIIAMIFWTVIVQQNIAMVAIIMISYLVKFINKMIWLTFQMANESFCWWNRLKKKNSPHASRIGELLVSIKNFNSCESYTPYNCTSIKTKIHNFEFWFVCNLFNKFVCSLNVYNLSYFANRYFEKLRR